MMDFSYLLEYEPKYKKKEEVKNPPCPKCELELNSEDLDQGYCTECPPDWMLNKN